MVLAAVIARHVSTGRFLRTAQHNCVRLATIHVVAKKESGMRIIRFFLMAAIVCVAVLQAKATVMAVLRGVVHDAQHRPIAGARVSVQSVDSALSFDGLSDSEGVFTFPAVQPGIYTVSVQVRGFATQEQRIELTSGTAPVLHFQMEVAAVGTTVQVAAEVEDLTTEAGTRTTVVSREDIARYAGADETNSFRIVTEFIPGAYMVHDQLHVRGGHQVTWAIDGVPLPNTNIAANVGPQFNPKDVDQIE